MPRTQVAAVTGESQDEYGQMDFDLDDPILNAMLGVEAVDDDGTAAKDLVFAQVSPAVRIWIRASTDTE